MDDTADEVSLEDLEMDAGPSGETPSSSGQLAACCPAFLLPIFVIFSCCSSDNKPVTVPRVAGNFENEFVAFMPVLREYYEDILGPELHEDAANMFRWLFSDWNKFLQPEQGVPDSSANISADIKGDIKRFPSWLGELRGKQLTAYKEWIERWLSRWNMFLQARTGETLVTRWNVCLTVVGFIFYIVDLVSDIGTSAYYAGNGQWWQAALTLTIVYSAVIIHTVMKWRADQIRCTGASAWLRYVAASLVNWPDLEQYGALCRVEWQLYKSSACSAHLVPEWHLRRTNVARLKYTEGVCEACPQAILQLCLLVPDLCGAWTWTDYLRIAGASVSLCTAGAALLNLDKHTRIDHYTALPVSELVVLHVWAVPVTVSRLLSVSLVLSVHLYWALAGAALHLVLCGVYWCRTGGVLRTLRDVMDICLFTLQVSMTPFSVTDSVTVRRVRHGVHFLLNTAMMVVWTLGTPLVCAHPALYTAIICFNAAMMAVGLVGMEVHRKYWLEHYPST